MSALVPILPSPWETVFWAATVFVAYTYFGYPVLLLVLAWLRPAPSIQKVDATPSLTVLIVVHNEEARLGTKLENCLGLDYPEERLDILVVSDGSRDATEAIARRFAAKGVRLLALPGPRGKAAAIADAVPHIKGEVVLLCDVRQEIEPSAAKRLVRALADPTVGAVSGELHLRRGGRSEARHGLNAYWGYEKAIRRLESRVDSTVGVTGALYAIRRDLLHPIDARTILDDVALPMKVVLSGRRVVFEPEARAWDEPPRQGAREFRRKVRTLAGNYQLMALNPDLLSPFRNRLWWQFLSHKVARLAVPWCLLVLLVTGAVLAVRGAPLFVAATLAQATLYALAALGHWTGRRGRTTVVVSMPYTFVLLNLAAVFALFGFIGRSQKAAWKSTEG